jgi:hypothetical protein
MIFILELGLRRFAAATKGLLNPMKLRFAGRHETNGNIVILPLEDGCAVRGWGSPPPDGFFAVREPDLGPKRHFAVVRQDAGNGR